MRANISGLEFKKFYSDDTFWGGNTYHDDVLVKEHGGNKVWADGDDLHSVPEVAVVTIESGWVDEINPDLTGGATEMSLEDYFKVWQGKQTAPLKVLVVECSAQDEARVREAILEAGGKISG